MWQGSVHWKISSSQFQTKNDKHEFGYNIVSVTHKSIYEIAEKTLQHTLWLRNKNECCHILVSVDYKV